MTKRKMYWMLSFVLFSFSLLAVVIIFEVNSYKNKTNSQEVIQHDVTNETPIVDNAIGVSAITDHADEIVSDEFVESSLDNDVKVEQGLGNNEDLYSNNALTNENQSSENTSNQVTMTFTGDVYLSRHVIRAYELGGIDGVIDATIKDYMIGSDITMINEEFPFGSTGEQAEDKQYTFQVEPKYVTSFLEMGVDIVTLANNHTLDFGQDSLLESLDVLSEKGIKSVGAGRNLEEAKKIQYIEKNGKTIAFLAASRVIPTADWTANRYNPGLFTTYDPSQLYSEIEIAKENSDFVVVYVHWGIERSSTPEEYQRTLGKSYIDHGADLVIGSHPHVLQGIEYYQGKPIVYSLGNFIFNNSIEDTALLTVTINEKNELALKVIPCYAMDGKTQVQSSDKWNSFYDRLESLSYGVNIQDGIITEKR